jgi:helicase MOV-10
MCVCEAIIQALRTQTGAKVLVCAPSDAACDVIASRLLSLLKSGNSSLLRINWWSRKLASVKPEILPHCPMDEASGLFTVPDVAEMIKADIVLCQCIVAECLELAGPPGWTKGHFSHLFIDECSQAMECETLVPIGKVRRSFTQQVICIHAFSPF